jgi:hypothetical protein
MDADDISLKDRLKIQLKFLEEHQEIDVVGCIQKVIGSEKLLEVPMSDFSIKSAMLLINPVAGPTTVVRINKQKYSYNESIRVSPDYLYWIENVSHFRFYNLQQVLYKYRINKEGLTFSENIAYESHFPMVKKHLQKFSIFITKNDFLTLRGQNNGITAKDLEKSSDIMRKILNIQNFYEYQGVDKMLLSEMYIFKVFDSWKNNLSSLNFSEGKKFMDNCIQYFPISVKLILLNRFYKIICKPFGYQGRIYFIRQFGIKIFLAIKIRNFFGIKLNN